MDPAIPKRARQLDFSGTDDQLVHFLCAFNSSPPSNASSIRLQVPRHLQHRASVQEDCTPFLSSPFPKLSILDLGNFLPDPSYSIFTTSKLTSLKLFLPYGRVGHYTLAQFSQILQPHPNLQKLDLNHGAIPFRGLSETPIPFVLPQLTDLRLHGAKGAILGFIDLIGTSSPLHDVTICFGQIQDQTGSALAGTLGKTLVTFYDHRPGGHHKIEALTISLPLDEYNLVFKAHSSTFNLGLHLRWPIGLARDKVEEETLSLSPSEDIQEFSVKSLPFTRVALQKMKNLLHLRLCNQKWP